MPRLRLALLVACSTLVTAAPGRADERVRVALLPLVVHSGEGRDYLQQGMTDMLVSRIGRDRRMAVIPVEDAAAATTDAAVARKRGEAEHAAYVVYGSMTRFGEGASVDLSVASVSDAAREPRTIYVHADTMGKLIPLLDGAAERVSGAVMGAAEPAAVAAGGAGGAAASGELEDLRRRVEALERAVFSGDAAPKPASAGTTGAQRAPAGLPSDRDLNRVR